MENQALYGKKVAILVADGFEQVEFTETREALEDAGACCDVISPEVERVRGWNMRRWGMKFTVDVKLADADSGIYDALLLPGGRRNAERLRTLPSAVALVRSFMEAGKPVAAICHGPLILIDAGFVRGRRLTSYGHIQADFKDAGAEWVDGEAVVDGNLLTSRSPDDIPAFNARMLELFGRGRARAPAPGAERERRPSSQPPGTVPG